MMPKQIREPGPGRSSIDAAFDQLRHDVARRNEVAQQKARKIRDARDREQVLARRARERL